jgi:hypothetical protein
MEETNKMPHFQRIAPPFVVSDHIGTINDVIAQVINTGYAAFIQRGKYYDISELCRGHITVIICCNGISGRGR